MTPIEYLKGLVKIYKKAFWEVPSEDPEVKSCRRGIIHAWELALEHFERLAKVGPRENEVYIAYLKDLIKTYEVFARDPSAGTKLKNFRDGMILAWEIAINGFELPDD